MPTTPTRTCKVCKRTLPLTKENFHLVNPKAKVKRYRTECKQCYNARRKAERQAKMDTIEARCHVPNLIVIDDNTGSYIVYEPVRQVSASSADVSEQVANFYRYRNWIVIEKEQ